MANPYGLPVDYCDYPIYGDISIWYNEDLQNSFGDGLYIAELTGNAQYIEVDKQGNYGNKYWQAFNVDDIVTLNSSVDCLEVLFTGINSAPSNICALISNVGQSHLSFSLYSDMGPWVDVNPVVFGSVPVPEPATWALFTFGLVGIAAAKRKRKH
jgi:hypothetical protein